MLTKKYMKWIDDIRKECTKRGVSYEIKDIPAWASSTDIMATVQRRGIKPNIVVDYIQNKSKIQP